MKKRSEIDARYFWDLSGYAKNMESALATAKKLLPEYENLTKFEGRLKDDEELFECLETKKKLDQQLEVVMEYCFLRESEDSENSHVEEISNMIETMFSDVEVKLSFIDAEINKFSNKKLDALVNNDKFVEYKEMFKEIKRTKKHSLSKTEEKILSRVSDFAGGFSAVFDMFDSSEIAFKDAVDSTGKKHPLNNSNYSVLVRSPDRELRKSAYKNLHEEYGKLNKTIATNYIYNVKTDIAFSKIRKFSSVLEKALFYEEIPEIVYTNLIAAVHASLRNFHKYFDLKRKMLCLKDFCIYDSYAENPNVPKLNVTVEEAFDLIKKALSPLGKEYEKILDQAIEDKWVDFMPNAGKSTGAFSSGAYGKNPVILMNFEGDLNSVFTLAHELGHSVHTYLSNKHQNILNSNYPIFLAEIASTTNEMLLLKYFIKNAKDDQEKLYYVDTFLSMVKSTIFRQTMFAEFEQIAHAKQENIEPLSASVLNQVYEDLNKLYFGENVEIDSSTKYEWSRIPHFYRSFYVYKYATGLIAAIAISNNVIVDKNYAKKYLKMLSMGGKLSPLETLNICDIDLTKLDCFNNAFREVEENIKEMEKLV